jgi:hypothetical protein
VPRCPSQIPTDSDPGRCYGNWDSSPELRRGHGNTLLVTRAFLTTKWAQIIIRTKFVYDCVDVITSRRSLYALQRLNVLYLNRKEESLSVHTNFDFSEKRDRVMRSSYNFLQCSSPKLLKKFRRNVLYECILYVVR